MVLTRKVNEPDLIFNQYPYKDLYFEQDAGEQWVLSEKSECFVCDKHKLTVIFYKNETLFPGPTKVEHNG